MPTPLGGRAESIHTVLRSFVQVLALLLFGAVSDRVFGGDRVGLQWTFTAMLVPLAASAALLYRALRIYPADVVTVGGQREEHPARKPYGSGSGWRGTGTDRERGPAAPSVPHPLYSPAGRSHHRQEPR